MADVAGRILLARRSVQPVWPGALCRWGGLGDNALMLIIIIAWLYVVILMALAEHSFIAGVMTLLLYGLLPLGTVVYLLNTPARRARKAQAAAEARARAAARGLDAAESAAGGATTEDGDPGRGSGKD